MTISPLSQSELESRINRALLQAAWAKDRRDSARANLNAVRGRISLGELPRSANEPAEQEMRQATWDLSAAEGAYILLQDRLNEALVDDE